MKILIYSQVYFPVLGGLQRNSFTLGNLLSDEGNIVTLVTETLIQGSTGGERFNIIRTQSRSYLSKLIREADWVIINGGVSLKACLLAYLYKKRYIIIYQTADGFRVDKGIRKTLLTPLRSFLAKYAISNVVQTNFAAKNFGNSAYSVTVLQNPVDPGLLATRGGKVDIAFDFLFAGRVISEKGIFDLIEAIKTLFFEGYSLRIAIAGSGEALEDVKAISEEGNLPIQFLGNIDQGELVHAYRSAKCLVVPTSEHLEGSPLVISEAISLGTPAIVSNQPAMIEAIGQAGFVFTAGDVNGLSQLLKKIVADESFYLAAKLACEREAGKFSPEEYRKKILMILKTGLQ